MYTRLHRWRTSKCQSPEKCSQTHTRHIHICNNPFLRCCVYRSTMQCNSVHGSAIRIDCERWSIVSRRLLRKNYSLTQFKYRNIIRFAKSAWKYSGPIFSSPHPRISTSRSPSFPVSFIYAYVLWGMCAWNDVRNEYISHLVTRNQCQFL